MKVATTLINPDIMETRLIRVSDLEKKLNFSNKDRAVELIVNEAKKTGSKGVTIGTR